MGDVSHEPSMEEILASIKRIIAEDGEGVPGARKPRAARSAPPPAEREDDGVLELTQRIDEPAAPAEPPPAAAFPQAEAQPPQPETERQTQAEAEPAIPAEPVIAPEAASTPRPFEEEPAMIEEAAPVEAEAEPAPEDQPLVSGAALSASRQSIAQLSQLLVKSETPGPGTLEALVRDMLRPMLKEWLDARLPDLVEQAVRREIARIVEQR